MLSLLFSLFVLHISLTLSLSLFQVAEKILLHMDNAYNIPNLRGQSAACRTNLPSNTAFRGFGVPQSMVVIENLVNDVAMALNRPAEEVRVQMSNSLLIGSHLFFCCFFFLINKLFALYDTHLTMHSQFCFNVYVAIQ